MAFEDLRKGIEDEAKSKSRHIEGEAEKEAHSIAEETKRRTEEILKLAREEAERDTKMRMQEGEAELSVEVNQIILSAKDEVVNREIGWVTKRVAETIKKRHMKELMDKAIEAFSKVMDVDQMRAEIDGKSFNLSKERKEAEEGGNGIMLYSHDKRIRLNGRIDAMIEGNLNAIRGIIARAVFED